MNFSKIGEKLKTVVSDVSRRFPMTILWSGIACGLVIYGIIIDDIDEPLAYMICSFILGTAFSLLMYVISENRRISINSIINACLSATSTALTYFLLRSEKIEEIYKGMGYFGCLMLLICCIAAVIYSQKNRRIIFPYLAGKFIFSGFISFIAFGGLLICILAFNYLIHEIDELGRVIWALSAITLAFCPFNIFISFIPREGDEISASKAYSATFNKVGFYIYLILVFILYLYIGKIIITGNMPVGMLNWFGSIALLFYAFFYLSLQEEDGFIQQAFIKYGALLLLPVLAVQLYAIYIRIDAYGLTTLRYMSLICIAAAVFVMINSLTLKRMQLVFICWAVLCLIASIGPFNVEDVPLRNQEHIAKTIVEKYDLLKDGKIVNNSTITSEEIEKLIGAWDYLRYNSHGDKKSEFAETFLKNNVHSVFETEDYNYKYSYEYVCNTGIIDISGYDRLEQFAEGTWDAVQGYDTKAFFEELVANAGDYILFDFGKELSIVVDESHKLVFASVYLDVNDSGEIVSGYVNGYCLTKGQ